MPSRLFSGELNRNWIYHTDEDTVAQVTASGYFDEQFTEFRAGDIINCVITENNVIYYYRLKVISSEERSVTTAIVLEGSTQEELDYIKTILAGAPGGGTNEFVVSLADNTLSASIASLPNPEPYHIIMVDDDSTPAAGSGLNVDVPLFKSLPDYNTTESWYLWLSSDNVTFTKVLPPSGSGNGLGGVDVQAVDTNNPTTALTLTANATNPNTQIDWVLTESDTQSGVDASRSEILDSNDNVIVPAPCGSSGTLTYPAGTTVSLKSLTYDAHGNFAYSQIKTITLSAVSQAGTVQFDDTQPTSGYAKTVSEADGSMTLNFTLSGNNDGITKGMQVKARTWTSTGQPEDLSTAVPADGVLSFASPGYTASLVIDLNDLDSLENEVIEYYLDPATATTVSGTDTPDIGTNNSILVKINGDPAGTTGAYQPIAAGNAAGRFLLSTDQIISTTPAAGLGNDWASVDPTTLADNTYSNLPAAVYTYDASDSFVNNNSYLDTAPAVNFQIEVPATKDYYIWVLMQSRTNANKSLYCAVDNVEANTSSANGRILSNDFTSTDTWDFAPLGYQSSPTAPLAVNLTAGTHTISICPREGKTAIARIHISDDSTYNPSENFDNQGDLGGTGRPIHADDVTLSSQGSGTAVDDPDNPTSPLGYMPSTRVTPALSPPDAATNQSTAFQLTMQVVGTTAVKVDDNAITVTSNGGQVGGTWSVSGDTITFSNTTWTAGATIEVTGTDFAVGINNGDKVGLANLSAGDWNFTVASTGGSIPAFANVTLPPGAMPYSWWPAVRDQFTQTSADDPIDWSTVPRLREVHVTSELGLQAALDSALPGDLIGLPSGNVGGWQVVMNTAGTAANPIYICPSDKASGAVSVGQPTIFDGGTIGIRINNSGGHTVIGGIAFKNQGENGIKISDADVGIDGPPNIRITDSYFERVGKNRGHAEDCVHVGEKAHNFRFDHNVLWNNYNGLRFRKVKDKNDVTKNARVDHNYFGPGAPDGYLTGVTYEISSFGAGTTTSLITNDDFNGVVEYNVFEALNRGSTVTDTEIFEIKSPGWTIRHNVVYGEQLGSAITLRHGFRHTVQSNYLVGAGIIADGANHVIEDNVIDCNGTLRDGISSNRWGIRNNLSTTPETHDNEINYNTIYNSGGANLTALLQIGIDTHGATEPVDNVNCANNHLETDVGTHTDFDFSNLAGGNGNGGGYNTNCTNGGNWYGGTASKGDMYQDASNELGTTTGGAVTTGVPASSGTGKGSRTLTRV